MMSNEAAERLRQEFRSRMYPVSHLEPMLDAALAHERAAASQRNADALVAERRATVEAIKKKLEARGWVITDEDWIESDASLSARMAGDVDAVLDEVAR